MWRPSSLRVRYTLRALLVVLTVVCLWCGLFGQRLWKLREIERTLAKHRAQVRYGRLDRPSGLAGQVSRATDFAANIAFLSKGRSTVFISSELRPEAADALCVLPGLENLRIEGPQPIAPIPRLRPDAPRQQMQLTPGSLERILAHQRLRFLTIHDCHLDERDLRAIGQDATLEVLSVFNSNLSEASFAQIVQLPKLQRLVVQRSNVSGAALANVPGSVSLEIINLSYTPVSVAFAEFAAKCPHLTELYVGHSSVDDAFVARLSGHTSLRLLSLYQTSITDASVPVFLSMEQLSILGIRGEQITDAEIDALERARPQLLIQ